MIIRRFVQRFVNDESATTAVEYCVMLGMILLLVIMGIYATGSGVSGWWNNINSEMTTHGF